MSDLEYHKINQLRQQLITVIVASLVDEKGARRVDFWEAVEKKEAERRAWQHMGLPGIPARLPPPVEYSTYSIEDARTAVELVMGFFDDDCAKVMLWFNTPNPQIGGVQPVDFLAIKGSQKLLELVKTLRGK
jgi:hypothetical protein